jgi:2-methylaconitate cis-trans-isomerase PrpF
MSQTWIPAAFYRGGSSKGVFFHARDLPADRSLCAWGIPPAWCRSARYDGAWVADSATVFRTARRLMQGMVAVPHAVLGATGLSHAA